MRGVHLQDINLYDLLASDVGVLSWLILTGNLIRSGISQELASGQVFEGVSKEDQLREENGLPDWAAPCGPDRKREVRQLCMLGLSSRIPASPHGSFFGFHCGRNIGDPPRIFQAFSIRMALLRCLASWPLHCVPGTVGLSRSSGSSFISLSTLSIYLPLSSDLFLLRAPLNEHRSSWRPLSCVREPVLLSLCPGF